MSNTLVYTLGVVTTLPLRAVVRAASQFPDIRWGFTQGIVVLEGVREHRVNTLVARLTRWSRWSHTYDPNISGLLPLARCRFQGQGVMKRRPRAFAALTASHPGNHPESRPNERSQYEAAH
jgi:hypothetical protein